MRIVIHLTDGEIISTQHSTFEEMAKKEGCSVEVAEDIWRELRLALEDFKKLTFLSVKNAEVRKRDENGGYFETIMGKVNINPIHIRYVVVEE